MPPAAALLSCPRASPLAPRFPLSLPLACFDDDLFGLRNGVSGLGEFAARSRYRWARAKSCLAVLRSLDMGQPRGTIPRSLAWSRDTRTVQAAAILSPWSSRAQMRAQCYPSPHEDAPHSDGGEEGHACKCLGPGSKRTPSREGYRSPRGRLHLSRGRKRTLDSHGRRRYVFRRNAFFVQPVGLGRLGGAPRPPSKLAGVRTCSVCCPRARWQIGH